MEGISLVDFLVGDFIPEAVKVIGIAGGSGSGKSYIAKRIAEKIDARILVVDDYIIPEKITKDSNWDLPECWNLDLLDANLKDFLAGRDFQKPVYDFKSGLIDRYETFEAGGQIVVEGLYSLYGALVNHVDLSIFVDSLEDVRLGRVIKRDFVERSGHNEAKITKRWDGMVQPAYLEYVAGQREKADLILIN